MERVLQVERDRAQAGNKQEVAQRPSSYKSSLSLAMPVGGASRHKEKHELPERQLHVTEGSGQDQKRNINYADKSRREAEQARIR